MAVDQYALCPCGSGKKIKFCKCYDSIGELDKVLKMVSGGQMVAALDRLNQVLAQHPSAAWPLAIKGRLLINLNEFDALQENADRFIRLQPSNPLALSQKAASQVFRQDVTAAAHSLLEALAESGRGVDAFLLEIASVLSMALAQHGQMLSARLYATLALSTQEFEDTAMAQTVLGQLNQTRGLNLLLKSLPRPVDRPDNAPWGERYDEANSLLRNNQILAAESKFEALDRQFPGQPAVLSGLLSCAIWRADRDAQVRLLRKLSDAIGDDPEQAARLLAIALLAEPNQPQLSVATDDLVYEIDDVETAILTLTSKSTALPIPSEALRALAGEGDDAVPPRAGFQILDREMPAASDGPIAEDAVPRVLAVAFIYGRQTDRAARLELLDAVQDDHAAIAEKLSDLLAGREPSERRPRSLPLVMVTQMRLPVPKAQMNREQARELQEKLAHRDMINMILRARVPASDDRPIGSLADDPATQRLRTAIVRVLQGYDALMVEAAEMLEELARRLDVPELPTLTPQGDEELEDLTAFDLTRVDPQQLDTEGLFFLFQRASQVSNTLASRRAAERLIEIEPSDDDAKGMISRAYQSLMQTSDAPEESLKWSERAKAWAQSVGVSNAPFLLAELQSHLEMGDIRGFESTVQAIATQHQHDQDVMMYLQQILMELGLINPDGTPRQAGRRPGPAGRAAGGPPATSETPLSIEPAGPAPGGSKLWLPGMD